jgi:hypothetical protein
MDVRRRAGLVALRAVIWGIAGGLFGVIFLGVLSHLGRGGVDLWYVGLAAAISGAVVGSFYSAKRVALVGAFVGSFAGVTYLTVLGTPDRAWPVLAVAGGLGLVGGALTSRLYGHKHEALLVAASGLVAGAIAGLAVVALAWLLGMPRSAFGFSLLLAPSTGALFAYTLLRAKEVVSLPVPEWIGVGPVAAVVAAVVSAGMWTLSANLGYTSDPQALAITQAILAELPGAFVGGLLGGAVAGAVLELLNVRWLYPIFSSPDSW